MFIHEGYATQYYCTRTVHNYIELLRKTCIGRNEVSIFVSSYESTLSTKVLSKVVVLPEVRYFREYNYFVRTWVVRVCTNEDKYEDMTPYRACSRVRVYRERSGQLNFKRATRCPHENKASPPSGLLNIVTLYEYWITQLNCRDPLVLYPFDMAVDAVRTSTFLLASSSRFLYRFCQRWVYLFFPATNTAGDWSWSRVPNGPAVGIDAVR